MTLMPSQIMRGSVFCDAIAPKGLGAEPPNPMGRGTRAEQGPGGKRMSGVVA